MSAVVVWINRNLVVEEIVTNIEEAAGRISDLVSSVKSFTHMDRGRHRQMTDIHVGITNTLKIFEGRPEKHRETFVFNLPGICFLYGKISGKRLLLPTLHLDIQLLNSAFCPMEGIAAKKKVCSRVMIVDQV